MSAHHLFAGPYGTHTPPVVRTMIVRSDESFEQLSLSSPLAGRVIIQPPPRAAAYLPVSGPLPLRFAEQERWPDPLPKEGAPVAIAEKPNLDPPGESEPQPPVPVPAPSGQQMISAGSIGKRQPADSASGIAAVATAEAVVLTAEMVTGFIDGIANAGSGTGVRFRPAVPISDRSPQAALSNTP